MKQAYKYGNLLIGKANNRLYINGGYWETECSIRFVPRSILGAVIEFAGRFPEENECIRATRDGVETIDHHVCVMDGDFEYEIEETPLMIESDFGDHYRLMQDQEGKILIAAESYIRMIDTKQVNGTNGETMPDLPYHNGYSIIWTNNVSKYRIVAKKLENQREAIIKKMQDIELTIAK